MRPVETSGQLPLLIEKGPHSGFLQTLVQALTRILINVAVRANGSLPKDGSEGLTSYTLATRPSSAPDGAIIYVTDAGAGGRFQGRDGGAWVNLG